MVVQSPIYKNVIQLETLLEKLTYKKGWAFGIVERTFRIKIETDDSLGRFDRSRAYLDEHDFGNYTLFLDPPIYDQPFWVVHSFLIPDRPISNEELERWVLDRIIDVETHEAMESFKIQGKAVYFPDHEPLGDPYKIERVTN